MSIRSNHSLSGDKKMMTTEKSNGVDSIHSVKNGEVVNENEFEVFKDTADVKFRTVSWVHATMIFTKIQFATGVMSIPLSLYALGGVGGGISIVCWGAVNTCEKLPSPAQPTGSEFAANERDSTPDVGKIQGDFRNRHAGCHSIADMANILGGPVLKEIIGIEFLIAYVLSAGSGILGTSIGINALSTHGACTVWWSFLATIFISLVACIRKFEKLSWVTLVGFLSVFIAVFIVVVGVTTIDRPAAAPQEGDFELGFYAIGHPTFMAGMVATSTIFVSSAATSAYMPVISEMRKPHEYFKALYVTMGFVTAAYFTFSMVVYAYCGQWVATPSLGSAGPTVKKVAYGVALIGLVISAALYLHVAAKYLFVRILRKSRHLQANTIIHWGTWLGCVFGLGAITFILASAIPIFNYLIAMVGSIAYAPIALIFPACLWLFDHRDWWKRSFKHQVAYALHWLLLLIGVLVTVGGTYAVIKQIADAYATGVIGSAFSCADNSNST